MVRFAPKLEPIPFCDWTRLRDLYLRDWPVNILSYNTIQNYIEWSEKNPKTDDIHIYSLDGNWLNDGTYILTDSNPLHCNVFFNTLSEKNQDALLAALKCLEREPEYTLTSYVERVQSVVKQHLTDLGAMDFSSGYCPTVLYYLPKEECLKIKVIPLQGFTVKSLSEKHAEIIDNLWPHQYPGSLNFIQCVIRYNITVGAFDDQTGELAAWCMRAENGTIGLLQVKERYKCKGLGSQLVRVLCRKFGEMGLDATATVMEDNLPSRKIFEKLAFKITDRVYWFDKPAQAKQLTAPAMHMHHELTKHK